MMHPASMLILCVLAGCSATDPYRRTDVWYPTGANAGNLAAMAVQPSDLILGRGARGSDGHEAVSAVERLWHDDTKALPPGGSGAFVSSAAPKSPAN